MKAPGIGIDITDIARFRPLTKEKDSAALKRLFTATERTYCLSHQDAAPHFAGIFSAKEAASKALGVRAYPYLALEIRHAKDGAPQVWKSGRRLHIKVSISHTATIASAVALP